MSLDSLIESSEFSIGYYTVVVILIISIILFSIYELYRMTDNDQHNDLNYNIYNWSIRKGMFLNFAWGSIIGHLFFGVGSDMLGLYTKYSHLEAWGGVVITVIISTILYFIGQKLEGEITYNIRLLLYGFGLFVGSFLWSMNF